MLVVDEFSVKYAHRADALHLMDVLSQKYKYTVDWTGSKYLGMTVVHDKTRHEITLSMPGNVQAALKRFQVSRNSKPTHSPAPFEPPLYGRHVQFTPTDESPPASPAETTYIQEVIGTFLYYARAVDCTMLTTLNKLASRQSKPTTALYRDVQHFLQYAATYPNAAVTYTASDMRLVLWSDGSYLSESLSRSRAGGYHYLTGNGDPLLEPPNGAIEAISTIIPTVVSAASEAEYAGLFINGQAATSTRQTLEDLGYPQQATPIITDNTTAYGIANRTVRLKRSKAIDMRYNWIRRDRVANGRGLTIHWGPRDSNLLAEYFFTKTHPPHHYRSMRATFVRDKHPFPLPTPRPRCSPVIHPSPRKLALLV